MRGEVRALWWGRLAERARFRRGRKWLGGERLPAPKETLNKGIYFAAMGRANSVYKCAAFEGESAVPTEKGKGKNKVATHYFCAGRLFSQPWLCRTDSEGAAGAK